MDEVISKQEAIEALCSECQGRCIPCDSYPCSEVEAINALPPAQPEQSIAEWQKDFREYINMLNIPRDDYNGIMEYINDVPSVQPEINCSEIPNTSDVVSRKAVREMVATWSYDMAEWEDVELALSDVDKLPSAHPEVIHCKYCALWHRTGCPMNVFAEKPEPGYFCGTAKRKESQCGYERQDVQTEENMQLTDLREEQEERLGVAPILNPK